MVYCYTVAMDAACEVVKMSEANYPENLRRIFIVNGNIRLYNAESNIEWNVIIVIEYFMTQFQHFSLSPTKS